MFAKIITTAILALSPLCSAVAVLPAGWGGCDVDGTDLLSVSNFTISPFPPVIGQNVTLYASANLTVPIVNGSYATITVAMAGVPIHSQTFDLCSDYNLLVDQACPIQPQQLEISYSMPVPTSIPAVALNVTIQAFNGGVDGGVRHDCDLADCSSL